MLDFLYGCLAGTMADRKRNGKLQLGCGREALVRLATAAASIALLVVALDWGAAGTEWNVAEAARFTSPLR